ncbi:MAG TPA: 3-isopropylmalate dehydratase small subunit [Polyangiaceae bacterium]
MAKFTHLESHMVPLVIDNIDTDQIIPARFLKVIDKQGLASNLFCDWRYLPDGSPKPDFALNLPSSQGAQVLLAGDNFGCGSSREHAPWALTGWGLRAVIATSFADIFRNNALKNGLLPVVVDAKTHAVLERAVSADPEARVAIDLESTQMTLPDGSQVSFPVDPFARHCLLNGIDELGYILSFEERIQQYEARAAS